MGCSQGRLTIQNDYITHEDLASYHVGSPDFRKEREWFGQRLILNWSVPKNYLKEDNIRIELSLRYRNRERAIKVIPLEESSGTYIYHLMNEDFFAKRGILTYQAKVISGKNEVKDTWTHQLWTDLLDIELMGVDIDKS